MSSQPAGREAAPGKLAIVQDFVNSWNIEDGVELFDRPESLVRWLRERGLIEPEATATRADLRLWLATREALRALLIANAGGRLDPDASRLLSELAANGHLVVTIGDDARPSLSPTARGVRGALARLLTLVVEADREGTWSRLKACANEGCRWAFYDRSHNRSGHWCSMSICGARSKMRVYRARRRDR
jgi:predicted RNA-binding Zn ribbon-like protein